MQDTVTKKRLFFATDLSPEVLTHAQDLMQELRKQSTRHSSLSITWARLENLHVTLKFLGFVDSHHLGQICAIAQNVAQRHSPFVFTAQRTGAFPSIERASVLWIGIHDNSGTAAQLAVALDQELSVLGIEREKREFHPHLTLGRVKKGSHIARQLIEPFASSELGSVCVDEFHLFESKNTPNGAVYTKLESFKLNQKLS